MAHLFCQFRQEVQQETEVAGRNPAQRHDGAVPFYGGKAEELAFRFLRTRSRGGDHVRTA